LASIQTHRRAVTDLNWSTFDSNLLATCAADTFVNLWDVRNARNSLKLKSFCGYTSAATQVKWSRLNRMLLASAHGGDIRIWDVRRESEPLSLITAHTLPIAGLDWSYTSASQLLSCSQDRNVKFWDVEHLNEPKLPPLHTATPLLRALYTPRGLAVATVPARDDCVIRLWAPSSIPPATTPIHSYDQPNKTMHRTNGMCLSFRTM
jgi:WD40 repeat protein